MTAPAGIDVIVPCYNYGRFLRQCAWSVLAETRLPIRLLIIDDASDDNSGEVARSIAAQDGRVEVVVHAFNQGHIATFNEGIAWLRARYMLLLSADDVVAPGALARAVKLMEAVPNLALAYGRSVQIRGGEELGGSIGSTPNIAAAKVWPGSQFVRRICAHPDNPVESATAVVRTAVLQAVGGYRPELPHAGDLEMWLRCAARGDVGFIPEIQAYTRIHDHNMRHGYTGAALFADFEQRLQAFELFFSHGAATLADAKELERLARRRLAEQALWAAVRLLDQDNRSARRLISIARRIQPSVVFRPLWWKTMARRAMGGRLRRALRLVPQVADARTRRGEASARPTGAATPSAADGCP
jgi:glycosyltransferase involved in cell wall biosynthesis